MSGAELSWRVNENNRLGTANGIKREKKVVIFPNPGPEEVLEIQGQFYWRAITDGNEEIIGHGDEYHQVPDHYARYLKGIKFAGKTP